MKKIILTLLVSLYLILGSYFTVHASAQIQKITALTSSISIVLFALPSFIVLGKWLGKKRAVRIIVSLSLFALAIETIGLLTGFPYGEFVYTDKIGYKLFGITPWTVPFAWVPLLLGVYAIVSYYSQPTIRKIVNTVLLLTAVDAVIDPAAVEMRFWQYSLPNLRNYYEVPLSNFAGWLISGSIGTLLFYNLLPADKRSQKPPRELAYSLYFILFFWTGVCFWLELMFPFLIGILFTGLCLYHLFKRHK